MSVNDIIGLVSTLLSTAIMVIAIIIALGNKKRAKAAMRNSILSKLRCKKEEMGRRENKIYYLIDLFKKRIITKKSFEAQVAHEYEQLRVAYREYKSIRMELTAEDLKTEKEDYSKSIEHIDSLIASMTGDK